MAKINEIARKGNINEVKTLKDGEYFGEQALLTNKPRSATIKCKTDAYVGVLTRTDYNSSIGKIHKSQFSR